MNIQLLRDEEITEVVGGDVGSDPVHDTGAATVGLLYTDLDKAPDHISVSVALGDDVAITPVDRDIGKGGYLPG